MSSPTTRLYTEFALAPLRATRAMVTHWTAYATANLPATPLRVSADLAGWLAALSVRERPEWAHHAEVVHRCVAFSCTGVSRSRAPCVAFSCTRAPAARPGHTACGSTANSWSAGHDGRHAAAGAALMPC